ncbi:MAG: EAL domain-containing protein [Deltaproteobacteria bacterium]|nr:EAL domain-containing protein [Deltaproteobacteria bacterium]
MAQGKPSGRDGLGARECAMFAAASDGIVLTDLQGAILDANPAFCSMTGYSHDELLGKNPRLIKSDRHDAEFYRRMWQALVRERRWQGEIWDRRRNGELFARWLTIDAVLDERGSPAHYVGVFSELCVAHRKDAEVERAVHIDPLTGLPNRLLLRDRLRQAMLLGRRAGHKVALLHLDLDGFKALNERYGHAFGDRLLAAVAERLRTALRSTDTAAREGGDELLFLLPETAAASDAGLVARKLLELLVEPFQLEASRDVRVSASIGIVMYPDDAEDIDELLAHAEAAMQRAKGAGRNRYHFYSRSLQARASQELELEAELRRALEQEQFLLYYQPQVDARRGQLTGVEALVRWNHPRQGVLPPARFLKVAEDVGLIVPLGEWVVRTACRQARRWRDQGLPPLRVAVNLAAAQFDDLRLVDRVAGWLIESGVDPRQFEVEITEGSAMRSPERTVERLMELKAIGVRVAIDDFGTGYSSLGYLKRFPVDTLKVDRTFLRDVPDDEENATLCAAVIGLARSLGMSVIAEGVETAAQVEFLREKECDELQGFLFSRPVPPDELARLARTRTTLLPEGLAPARSKTPARQRRGASIPPRSAPARTTSPGISSRRKDR